jgi:hypothetical protein
MLAIILVFFDRFSNPFRFRMRLIFALTVAASLGSSWAAAKAASSANVTKVCQEIAKKLSNASAVFYPGALDIWTGRTFLHELNPDRYAPRVVRVRCRHLSRLSIVVDPGVSVLSRARNGARRWPYRAYHSRPRRQTEFLTDLLLQLQLVGSTRTQFAVCSCLLFASVH